MKIYDESVFSLNKHLKFALFILGWYVYNRSPRFYVLPCERERATTMDNWEVIEACGEPRDILGTEFIIRNAFCCKS